MSKEINKETLEKLQEIADYKNMDLDRLIKAFNYLKSTKKYANADIFIIDELEVRTNLINYGVEQSYEGETDENN